MRIAGLGEIHEEIEKQKRAMARRGKNGMYSTLFFFYHYCRVLSTFRIFLSSHTPIDSIMISFKGSQGIQFTNQVAGSRYSCRLIGGNQEITTRVHSKHLSQDTLAAYNMAWHWDDVCLLFHLSLKLKVGMRRIKLKVWIGRYKLCYH